MAWCVTNLWSYQLSKSPMRGWLHGSTVRRQYVQPSPTESHRIPPCRSFSSHCPHCSDCSRPRNLKICQVRKARENFARPGWRYRLGTLPVTGWACTSNFLARCTRPLKPHLFAISTVVYDHIVPKRGGLPPNVGNGSMRGEASLLTTAEIHTNK